MQRLLHLSMFAAASLMGCSEADHGHATDHANDDLVMQPERPAGWEQDSHGKEAAADYERVFAANKVQRIDIQMPPETQQQLLDNLTMLLGEPRMRGLPGAPGGAQGGMFSPMIMRGLEACEGKRQGYACTAGFEGSCELVFGRMACIPEGVMIPGAPGTGGRPVDRVDLVPGEPEYVPVTVRYDDGTWTQVGMRFKGNSSLAAAWGQGIRKLGFRLHFDRYEAEQPAVADQRFHGFRELTFSSGWNDPSLIRDALSSEVMQSLGLASARTAFYQVYVDAGEGPRYWGLYTMVEDPSDAMLAAQFGDGSGNLYKPEGAGATLSSFVQEDFEKKTNETQGDYGDVMAAIEALNAPRDDQAAWRARLESVFDVPTFLQVLAVSRAIGHWDSYGIMPHNYYLYADPARGGRLVWISWDHNLTWAPMRPQGMPGFGIGLSVMMDEVTSSWPLIRLLLDDPVYRATYVTALQRSLDEGLYPKAAFDARARQLHAMVAPYVIGGQGAEPEQAPYTFLPSAAAFNSALNAPQRGLIEVADQFRTAVVEALRAE